ncbi:MAG TPA: DUF6502 family protein [Gammaproteobacteria bacterium]
MSRERLLQACYSFMLPVAKFLLSSGISFAEFSEVSKAAFVKVATEDYGIRGRPTNISRVSAMTGITRKEVRRFRESSSQYESRFGIRLGPLTEVLHGWFTDPDFTEHGRPRVLKPKGAGSFAQLVRKYAGDLPAGAVRVELIRSGAVREANGNLQAIRRHLIPADLDDRLALSLDLGLRGHARTVAYNCDPGRQGKSMFERVVFSDTIPEPKVAALRATLQRRATAFTARVDDLLAQTEEGKGGGAGKRIGLGIYYFEG